MTASVEAGYVGNGEVVSALKNIDVLSTVGSVDLSGNSLCEADLLRIIPTYIAPMNRLKTLDIKDNQFGRQGLVLLLATLQHSCRELTSLDVSENNIMDESLFEVAHYMAVTPSLRVLSLITNGLTPRGIPTLCDGLGLSSLVELSLAYNSLGDRGTESLVETIGARVPTLTFLDISDNGVADRGLEAISKHLVANPKCNVQSVALSCNKFGDEGLKILTDALLLYGGNKQLAWLDLGCNPNVTEDGRRYFASAARGMPFLHSVDLSTMDVGPQEAKDLVRALRTPKHQCALRKVYFFNNPRIAGENGEADLTEAMALVEELEAQRVADKKRFWLTVAGVSAVVAMSVGAIVAKRVLDSRRK